MVAAACDTNVFHVNAAVDYGYVCVFINGQYNCGINNFCNFYRNCVVAFSVNFQSSCSACFSGSSFHFQTGDFHIFCACDTTFDVCECQFIVIPFLVRTSFAFVCSQFHIRFCEFKTAAQFQSDAGAVFQNCAQSIAYSGFDFQFFQFNHFVGSNINSIFYGCFDAFAFNGSVCQVGTTRDCDIVGFNSYFCLFAFGSFVHYGSQIESQNSTSLQFTADGNFHFVCICVFQGCYFNFVFAIVYIECSIFYAFRNILILCFVTFDTDSQIAFISNCAAGFVEIRVVQGQCVLCCKFFACRIISCCKCQLYFRTGYFFVCTFCILDLVLCVVLGTHNLSCSFYVAGSRKCSTWNQGYDHSRSHHHGKKFLHGSFLLLSRLFISFSFHNYTTNLPLVCTASLPSATGKNGTSCTAVHSPIPQRASDSLVQSSSVPKRYRESTDFVCKFIILMHSIFGKRKFRM